MKPFPFDTIQGEDRIHRVGYKPPIRFITISTPADLDPFIREKLRHAQSVSCYDALPREFKTEANKLASTYGLSVDEALAILGDRPNTRRPGYNARIPGAAIDDNLTGECNCEFTPYDDGDEEESWHFLRRCQVCGHTWFGLHCPHGGCQNPCHNCYTTPKPVAETA